MVSAVTVTLALLFAILQVSLSGYVYLDAPEWDLDNRKWALVTLFIPFFGIFAYLFERDERRPDPDRDRRDEMFVDGAFTVHKSRADDAPWISDAKANAADEARPTAGDEPPESDGDSGVDEILDDTSDEPRDEESVGDPSKPK